MSDLLLFENVTAPRLSARGKVFVRDSGSPFTAIQASDFNLLGLFAAGTNIEPVLTQRQACGFNMLRVFTLYELEGAGIGRLNPCPYGLVQPFAELCGSFGFAVELVAYTSLYDEAHWNALVHASSGCPNVLLERCNELDMPVNRIPSVQSSAGWGLLSSFGSYSAGSYPPASDPTWSYVGFHTNDLPQWWRKVGHNAMEVADLCRVPVLSNENTRFPDRDSSPQHAFDAAAGAALLCAGSGFHSVHGKSSQLFEGAELVCAQAWAAGAHSVDLAFQGGAYVHRTDLETAGVLRAYGRRTDAGEATVVIRV